MTIDPLYSVGDSVRVERAAMRGVFATIESVCEHTRTYVVRYRERDDALDQPRRTVVGHDHCTRYRKQRYDVGDRVELYPEPIHEGPHPDDQFTERRLATITSVDVHPHNEEWVLSYGVVERDGELSDYEHTIKPGAIARLDRTA